jgi:hypothetical protein
VKSRWRQGGEGEDRKRKWKKRAEKWLEERRESGARAVGVSDSL